MTTCLPLSAPEQFGDDLIVDEDQLLGVFYASERPPDLARIGLEAEKFGVDVQTGAPLQYDAPDGSLLDLFAELERTGGWQCESEYPMGPAISLRRGSEAITLEPGGQLELSGSPCEDLHAVTQEFESHLRELGGLSRKLRLAWLATGFHPLARQDDLPWVPKLRYPVMRTYLMTRGRRALDMMRRTATVQANFDYSSERDAMAKLTLLLRLAPVLGAMFANAPFAEGRLNGTRSLRQQVWLDVDSERAGLIPSLWTKQSPTYRDYVQWALRAGMFLFKRNGQLVVNAGQTFGGFLRSGYEGHLATLTDWKLHLGTLFPEVRLKGTLEVRCCDSLPAHLVPALPALLTGLLYDARALDQARELALSISYEDARAAQLEVPALGLRARIGARPMVTLAERLLEIASSGLQARRRFRADGNDERVYLKPLEQYVARGRCPADDVIEAASRHAELSPRQIIELCRLPT